MKAQWETPVLITLGSTWAELSADTRRSIIDRMCRAGGYVDMSVIAASEGLLKYDPDESYFEQMVSKTFNFNRFHELFVQKMGL